MEIAEIIKRTTRSPVGADQVQVSLELGAALGMSVDTREWRQACESVDAPAGEAFVKAIIEHGIAVEHQDGWAFKTPQIRQALQRQATEEQRWRGHHATCAHVLFTLYSERTPGIAKRRAAHLLAAGKHEEALEPLLQVEREVYDAGDFGASAACLDQRERILDALGADDDDPRRAQNHWRRARLLISRGEPKEALSLLDASMRVLRHTGWASECGNAALLRGRILRDQADEESALQSFDEAIAHFAIAGDEHGLATGRASRGLLHLFHSDYALARKYFSKALEAFEALDDSYMIGSLLNFMGQAWLSEGNHQEGLACVERARDVARRGGHLPNEAAAWNTLGELARDEHDWEEARRCYGRAFDLFESYGSRSAYIARYNLALVEIAAADFVAAQTLLDGLDELYDERGMRARMPLIHAALLTCAAGQQDWESWQVHHQDLRESLEDTEFSHADIIWMARRAADLADEGGQAWAKAQALAIIDEQFARRGESSLA